MKESEQPVEFAVKYQVLSKETALVGVIKQKDKATGELKTHEEHFVKNEPKINKPVPVPMHHHYGMPRGGGFGVRGGRGGGPMVRSRAMKSNAISSAAPMRSMAKGASVSTLSLAQQPMMQL